MRCVAALPRLVLLPAMWLTWWLVCSPGRKAKRPSDATEQPLAKVTHFEQAPMPVVGLQLSLRSSDANPMALDTDQPDAPWSDCAMPMAQAGETVTRFAGEVGFDDDDQPDEMAVAQEIITSGAGDLGFDEEEAEEDNEALNTVDGLKRVMHDVMATLTPLVDVDLPALDAFALKLRSSYNKMRQCLEDLYQRHSTGADCGLQLEALRASVEMFDVERRTCLADIAWQRVCNVSMYELREGLRDLCVRVQAVVSKVDEAELAQAQELVQSYGSVTTTVNLLEAAQCKVVQADSSCLAQLDLMDRLLEDFASGERASKEGGLEAVAQAALTSALASAALEDEEKCLNLAQADAVDSEEWALCVARELTTGFRRVDKHQKAAETLRGRAVGRRTKRYGDGSWTQANSHELFLIVSCQSKKNVSVCCQDAVSRVLERQSSRADVGGGAGFQV